MSEIAIQLLNTFSSLSPREQHEVLLALLRSSGELPSSTMNDDQLVAIAEEVFLSLEPDSTTSKLKMKSTSNHDERFAKMTFSSVYPLYLAKVEKKGRTKEELHQVITWLTGFNEAMLQKHIDEKLTFEQFFKKAKLNANASLITGVICGYRVEEIENPLTQKVRYLDKLVDELAKGRKMEKILRVE